MRTIIAVIIGILLLASGTPGEGVLAGQFDVQLKSRTFFPAEGSGGFFAQSQAPQFSGTLLLADRVHGMVQFYELPDESRRTMLEKEGIVLHDYIPSNAYSASISLTLTPGRLTQLGIRHVSLFLPTDKIDAGLLAGTVQTRSSDPNKVSVYVLVYPDIPVNRAREVLLKQFDCTVLSSSEDFKIISIEVRRERLEELAALEWVSWIEGMLRFQHRNDGSRALIKVDQVQAPPYNLTGSGLKLGMWDGGRVYAHSAFTGRLTIKNNVADSWHATHVAGTMAGDGANSTNNYRRGMAPAAQILSWSFMTANNTVKSWDSVATEMRGAVDQDTIVLSQNSWGDTGGGGTYTVGSRLMDQIVRQKNVSVIFAVGYGGRAYSSMWSPETGKNLIAVTATTKTGGIWDNPPAGTCGGTITLNPSRGPCNDGRLKPDISAAGIDIYSTWTDNGYCSWTGTSMAAPAISGTIGLLIERFKQLNSGALPSPALLKAVLLNTAKDTGNVGPDYIYGYGIADALRAVKTIDASAYLVNSIFHGSTNNHTLTIPSSISQVRVMLAYTDREASVNANPALVNNLDLKLIAPNAQQYLPLTLNPSNPTAPAQPAVNNRDNVEQVVVSNPMAGNWTIRITAPTVPFGPQGYAITWDMPAIPVIVDQKLAASQTSVDSIGRWEGGPDFARYAVPKQFSFSIGSHEALRGAQKIISNQKYNKWSIDDTVINHRKFSIVEGFPDELISQFVPTHPTITIRTDLIDAPGTTGGTIQFHDPWYIDFQDGAYGSNWRNRGMVEPRQFHTRSVGSTGFQPDFTTIYPAQGPYPYNGVFLNLPIVSGRPYYSVGAPRVNTFTVGGYNYQAYFQGWTGNGDSVGYQNPNARQTGVVFRQPDATAVAKAEFAQSYNAQPTMARLECLRDSKEGCVDEAVRVLFFRVNAMKSRSQCQGSDVKSRRSSSLLLLQL